MPGDQPPPARTGTPVDGPALYVVVGLPGAGKTTRALVLAEQHGAVRFNPDEWTTWASACSTRRSATGSSSGCSS